MYYVPSCLMANSDWITPQNKQIIVIFAVKVTCRTVGAASSYAHVII